MTSAIQFRLPQITTILTRLFGIPKGTFGRGAYSPECIILHSTQLTLDSYDAQVIHPEYLLYRDRAQPIHPSLHFAVGYGGEVHQFVNVADVAWGLWDYDMGQFPDPYPEGDSPILDLHAGVSPDRFAIHIGAMSGIIGEPTPMTAASIKQHARLIAYYCNLYEIDCDTDHVVMHGAVDLQFANICVADAVYPYAAILAAAQAIIAAGGEDDLVFSPPPIIDEFFGPFTLNVSRLSSASYLTE